MDQEAERALIERCRAGDERAFAELVDAHKDLVHAMIWRLARDRSQLDDLAQDVFLKVHRGLPYFRGEARLSTWIYRIVMNVCSQSKPRHPGEVSLDGDRGGRPIELRRDDAAFAEMELRDRLEKAIAKLPEQYRVLGGGASSPGRSVRSPRRGAGDTPRNGENTPPPGEAPAARTARRRSVGGLQDRRCPW